MTLTEKLAALRTGVSDIPDTKPAGGNVGALPPYGETGVSLAPVSPCSCIFNCCVGLKNPNDDTCLCDATCICRGGTISECKMSLAAENDNAANAESVEVITPDSAGISSNTDELSGRNQVNLGQSAERLSGIIPPDGETLISSEEELPSEQIILKAKAEKLDAQIRAVSDGLSLEEAVLTPYKCDVCGYYTGSIACPDCKPKEHLREINETTLLQRSFAAAQIEEAKRLSLCVHECRYCGEAWSHRLKSFQSEENEKGICPSLREATLDCPRCETLRQEIGGRLLAMMMNKGEEFEIQRLKEQVLISPDQVFAQQEKMCHEMNDLELEEHIRGMEALAREYKQKEMAGRKVRRAKVDKNLVEGAAQYRLNPTERKEVKEAKTKVSVEEKAVQAAMLAFDMTRQEAEKFVRDHPRK